MLGAGLPDIGSLYTTVTVKAATLSTTQAGAAVRLVTVGFNVSMLYSTSGV